MASTLDLAFPKGISESQAKALAEQLNKLQGVQSSGIEGHRAVDPATLMGWVTLASAAVPVISAVVDMIRGKAMKGVKLKIGDQSLDVDEASAGDIELLAKALGQRKP